MKDSLPPVIPNSLLPLVHLKWYHQPSRFPVCVSYSFFALSLATCLPCAVLITQTWMPSPTTKISLSTITLVVYLGSYYIDKGDPCRVLPPQFLDLFYTMFFFFLFLHTISATPSWPLPRSCHQLPSALLKSVSHLPYSENQLVTLHLIFLQGLHSSSIFHHLLASAVS